MQTSLRLFPLPSDLSWVWPTWGMVIDGQEKRKAALSSSTTSPGFRTAVGAADESIHNCSSCREPSYGLYLTQALLTLFPPCPIRFRDVNDFWQCRSWSSSLMFSKQLCWSIMHIPYTSLTLSVQFFLCVYSHTCQPLCVSLTSIILPTNSFRVSSKCAFCFWWDTISLYMLCMLVPAHISSWQLIVKCSGILCVGYWTQPLFQNKLTIKL